MASHNSHSSGNAPSLPEHLSSPAAYSMKVDPAVDNMSIKDALVGLENEIYGLMVKIATAGDKRHSVVDPWKEALKVKRSDHQELVEMSALLFSGALAVFSIDEGWSTLMSGMVSAANIVPSGLNGGCFMASSGSLKVEHTQTLHRFLSDELHCVVQRHSNCLKS